jgi:hypothetical protein
MFVVATLLAPNKETSAKRSSATFFHSLFVTLGAVLLLCFEAKEPVFIKITRVPSVY